MISFTDWLDQLKALYVKEFGVNFDTNIDQCHFYQYYEDDFSPQEAFLDDLSYGD